MAGFLGRGFDSRRLHHFNFRLFKHFNFACATYVPPWGNYHRTCSTLVELDWLRSVAPSVFGILVAEIYKDIFFVGFNSADVC